MACCCCCCCRGDMACCCCCCCCCCCRGDMGMGICICMGEGIARGIDTPPPINAIASCSPSPSPPMTFPPPSSLLMRSAAVVPPATGSTSLASPFPRLPSVAPVDVAVAMPPLPFSMASLRDAASAPTTPPSVARSARIVCVTASKSAMTARCCSATGMGSDGECMGTEGMLSLELAATATSTAALRSCSSPTVCPPCKAASSTCSSEEALAASAAASSSSPCSARCCVVVSAPPSSTAVIAAVRAAVAAA